MGGEKFETQTGQPGPGNTQQFGDPARLKIQQASFFFNRSRGRDFGTCDTLDLQNLTPI